jgi:predicted metal-dependent phosphoesterase TrpH
MSPRKIIAQARNRGLAIIGICDHNTAENVPALARAAETTELVVLPGMEVCTMEEIHLLAVFKELKSVDELQSIVYGKLPGKNDPEVFGLQVIANEQDEVVAFEDRLLIGAVDLPVEEIVSHIHRLGGIAIASHVDKERNSVISQLGFIPPDLKFDALEVSRHTPHNEAVGRFAQYSGFPLVRNSDAHFIDDVGTNTTDYLLERPSFGEIMKALKGEDGRMVCEN